MGDGPGRISVMANFTTKSPRPTKHRRVTDGPIARIRPPRTGFRRKSHDAQQTPHFGPRGGGPRGHPGRPPGSSPRPPTARRRSRRRRIPQVRVITSMGNFVMELYPDRAPITVAEFLKYVNEGQYTQTLFHRVDPGLPGPGRRLFGSRRKHQADPSAHLQRVRQRPAEQARLGGAGPHRGAAQRQLPVLHQPGGQPGARSPAGTVGLCSVRQGHRRHGRTGPDQHRAHGRRGQVQGRCTACTCGHREDRTGRPRRHQAGWPRSSWHRHPPGPRSSRPTEGIRNPP